MRMAATWPTKQSDYAEGSMVYNGAYPIPNGQNGNLGFISEGENAWT